MRVVRRAPTQQTRRPIGSCTYAQLYSGKCFLSGFQTQQMRKRKHHWVPVDDRATVCIDRQRPQRLHRRSQVGAVGGVIDVLVDAEFVRREPSRIDGARSINKVHIKFTFDLALQGVHLRVSNIDHKLNIELSTSCHWFHAVPLARDTTKYLRLPQQPSTPGRTPPCILRCPWHTE
jgi:hypothetical protein